MTECQNGYFVYSGIKKRYLTEEELKEEEKKEK